MRQDDLGFLTSPLGIQVLADLADADLSDAATLPLLTRLRKTLAPDQAAAAVEQAKLRRKAEAKFGADAVRMFFTRDALEQASDPQIRRYRAIEAHGIMRIIDAGCGIGADALEFAKGNADSSILGLDTDSLRIEVARRNAAALGLTNVRFEVADVTQPLPVSADLIFFDPARRDETGRRLHHVEQYQPPLSTVHGWDAPRVWVKLSPAVDLDELEAYQGRLEFHSVEGDLKEALLRIDRTPSPALPFTGLIPAAVVHAPDGSFTWRWTRPAKPVPESAPRGWLIEPDPAILRAGYVQQMAQVFGAAQIDVTLAYLTTDDLPEDTELRVEFDRWTRAWRVIDWMPFSLKRLKAYVREHGIGRVTVKKRGHAMSPEELLSALKPSGEGEERVIVLTRVKGQPAIIVCEPPNV